ncbi:hypothetical protein BJ546DRAFT_1059418 [Cryomyces antarcticus]
MEAPWRRGRTLIKSFHRPSDFTSPHRPCKVDTASGQVFTETICRVNPVVNWASRATGRTPTSPGRGCTGPTSLERIALRTITRQLSNIDAQSLSTVPWIIGAKIWKQTVLSGLDSHKIWAMFAARYGAQDETLKTRKLCISSPSGPLEDNFKHVSSSSFAWITYLSISDSVLSSTDLLKISGIHNLGALDIQGQWPHGEPSPVSDKVIRAWSRHAAEGGSFSKLHVLTLYEQKDVTAMSLTYLNDFPVLVLYNVAACGITPKNEATARQEGWTSGDSPDGVPQRDRRRRTSRYLSLQVAYEVALPLIEALGANVGTPHHDLPILNFRLGPDPGPRTYSPYQGIERVLSFRRTPLSKVRGSSSKTSNYSERGRDEEHKIKKRKIRSSKHQTLESILSGL